MATDGLEQPPRVIDGRAKQVEPRRAEPHLVEGVLRDFPHVLVVISSTWREITPPHEIQAMFSEDVRLRIVGTTPLVDIEYPPGPVGSREREIRIFLDQPEFIGRNWLALDDAAPLSRLVATT